MKENKELKAQNKELAYEDFAEVIEYSIKGTRAHAKILMKENKELKAQN